MLDRVERRIAKADVPTRTLPEWGSVEHFTYPCKRARALFFSCTAPDWMPVGLGHYRTRARRLDHRTRQA